jgi:hypothetical protein
MGLRASLFWEQLAKHLTVIAILAAVILPCKLYLVTDGLFRLAIVGGLSCLLAWSLSAAIILSYSDREMFGRFARAMALR